jgi:hypothetical protein
MATEFDPGTRLGRDHAALVDGFSRVKFPSRFVRRTRLLALRKTLVLLASALAGMFTTALAMYALTAQANGGDAIPATWLIVISICIPLGALAGFVLLVAQEHE